MTHFPVSTQPKRAEKMMRSLRSVIPLAALLSLLGGCLWGPVLREPPLRDEVVHAVAEDGWRIAMHHYLPGPGVTPRQTPIIICHGISANARTWSLNAERSLPRYLADRGWDVWSIDLRGVGESDSPGIFDRRWYSDFDFDSFVTQDVPAVIAEVMRRTGQREVHWIGHSMGGMVIYGYVSTFGDAKLKSVTTVGSPVAFDGLAGHLAWAQRQTPWFAPYLFTIRDQSAIAGISVFGGVFETRAEYMIWNYDNLNRATVQRIMYNGIGNMSGGVLKQFAGMFAGGPFTNRDGTLNYLDNLDKLTVPFHALAGSADNLALVQNVYPAYARASSQEKDFTILSRANGFAADYGHVDLQVGDNARRDVYPTIERWLRRHD
jgi:pimeloyl-ACP methyl ester carboxylesterase